MDNWKRIDRVLRYCEHVMGYIANFFLLLIMMTVVIDVMLRYFFNAPLGWSYELVSLYLMVGLFFFSLAGTLNANGHVSVDLVQAVMPGWMRHMAEFITYLCTSAVLLGIFVVSLDTTLVSYHADEVIAGAVLWPTWLSKIAVPIGIGVLLLRVIFRLIGHGVSLFRRSPIIELPPLSGQQEN